jgi:hypothetical protein
MALSDLQAFIIERLQQVDNTLDLTPGSPYDVQVIQPILRRLGTDPFTVDIGLFIQTLLNQQFPDLPTKEGDAITDLLIKAGILLWNPIVREITRVSNNLSFRDPTILTVDEAEALGANLFAQRITGDFSRGTARLYFAQPQSISVSPANFVTAKSGLHFYPTEIQSIRVEEMLLNIEGSLYYFDFNVVAEAAGDQYNIGADELITIANVASAVRITNKVRFRSGTPDENAVTFIGRIEQELTERSLVTQRGIVAKVTKEFPEVTRLNIVGFNDPEMGRDILTGGGLGPILAGGVLMFALADGESAVATRRVSTTEPGVDFTTLIGPSGKGTSGYVLTLAGAFPPASLPVIRDLDVLSVVDAQTIDLVDQVVSYTATAAVWTLRKKTLTLSGIPGGILFPDTPFGTITMPDNQVHIGGTTDIYVRGTAFDPDTLILSDIVDDAPLLKGIALTFGTTTSVVLNDLVLGVNYSVGDATHVALQNAAIENLSLQVLDPPNAATYRILQVIQTPGLSPLLTITPAVLVVAGDFRWRLSSSLFIDLVEPKETKVAGSDLRTTLGSDVVDTISGVDFDSYGVGVDDILRITTGGLIVGDYVVKAVLAPLFTKLQVDRKLPASVTSAQYSVFRRNLEGGLSLPFVRIATIDVLDASGQPIGATVPYALPIDGRSSGFANAAHGIKSEVTDAILGIVTLPFGPAGANVNGLTLDFNLPLTAPLAPALFTVTFAGVNPIPLATLVSQINAAAAAATAGAITRLAVLLDSGQRLGILPVAEATRIIAGTAMVPLFGYDDKAITVKDVTSVAAYGTGGWAALRPALDPIFDVVQVLDGLQIGFYHGVPAMVPFDNTKYDPLRTDRDFNPEVRRHIQVGSRSLGTARLYFLEPTSFEVDSNSMLTITNADGSELNFFPDPTNNYQRIPPKAGGIKPLDGSTGGPLAVSTFESLTTDFIQKGIRAGDLLVIDYVPLVGALILTDPVVGLNTQTLIVSINGGVNKSIIFIHDSGAIPAADVTRKGVVDQINKAIGQVICGLDATNHLRFNPDASVIIRPTGTANAALGFSTTVDQNNDSPDKGTYTISVVAPAGNPNRLTVSDLFPTGISLTQEQQFKVFRAGLQRIVSTEMAKNLGTAGLYYFDVELVSQGTGDIYNVAAGLRMTVTGFRSDGYSLTTDDANLTFSPVERPKLHVSRSILEVGVSDDPANATQLAGQNLQVNYERSSLAGNVDSFSRSETERVINESPLGRHLVPYFVRFDLTYAGGSKEDVVTPDLTTYIQELYPNDALDVSDLEKLVSNRGATAIDNPIDLIAVIHNVDRTVTVERSQNKLNTGRLAAFIPDVLTVTRRIA